MIRRSLRAMGTDLELLVVPDRAEDEARDALEDAVAEVGAIERIASRFDPGSELSRLNAAGRARVSVELLRMVRLAVALRAATGGRFDPTMGRAVAAAGYDRTLDEVPADGPPPGPPAPGGGRVRIDDRGGIITLGPGVALDLGGIAKGWAADRAADVLGATGSCLVSVGGDIAVRGAMAGSPWPVGIVRGDGPATLALWRGGMATSGRDRRHWRRAGEAMHHVIDPATGAPSATDLVRVTVVAGDAAHAEAWATALLVAGCAGARRLSLREGLPAVLVRADGATLDVGGVG
ncbi:MAG: FAD:protein FMN transferase [Miltoncostaeaceae bacterium]